MSFNKPKENSIPTLTPPFHSSFFFAAVFVRLDNDDAFKTVYLKARSLRALEECLSENFPSFQNREIKRVVKDDDTL